MPASEFQKKAISFVVVAGLIVLALILFPALEELVRGNLAATFGLIVAPDGSVSYPSGDGMGTMTSTYVGVIVTVIQILKVILAMALVVAVVRFFSYLVKKTVNRNASQGEISSLLHTVLSIIVYIVAFFIIFQSQFPGIQLTALFTGSTIVGIVVGLALQDTLGNLFAGLALQADQSFQVGDVISVGTLGNGVVESVSWRGAKIRTFQNKLLVISNAALGKESLEVAPKDNLNARLVFFNTVYTASPAHTAQVVREAIRVSENVSPKIRPIVRVRALGADGIDWEIKYWLDDYSKYNDTDALIRQRVWYAFQREKIQFAFATRTIHIEEKAVEAAPEEIVNTIADRLNRVSIFMPLSEDEIEKLANASTSRVYAPGETIVRKGQKGGSMFVIISGAVKVQIPERDYQKTINNLAENDFFGEMSLLTGEPRTANVIAVAETKVLRIDKDGLKPIFESNPTLVDSICEQIEERKELVKTTAAADDAAQTTTRRGVMTSIRSFFGLKQ